MRLKHDDGTTGAIPVPANGDQVERNVTGVTRRLMFTLLLAAALVAVVAADPFPVATYADLCKIGTGDDGWTLNANYIQTNDIACPAEANFPRIGRNPGGQFSGTYDGQNYTIRDMTLHYSDYHTGMFVVIGSEGTVRNVNLINVDVISGSSRAGALAGLVTGTVINCHSSGTITGNDVTGGLIGEVGFYKGSDSATTVDSCTSSCNITAGQGYYPTQYGGLIGYLQSGTVTRCITTGYLTDCDMVGGLIGYAEGGLVTQCSSNSTITSPGWAGAGGLIGKSSATVINCYASGSVTAPSIVGGLIGVQNGKTVTSSYASGYVVGTDYPLDKYGGLVGDGGNTALCFWDIDTSGQATSSGAEIGKTTLAMQSLATYSDWSIATPPSYAGETWYIVPGEDYPRLAWEGVPEPPPPPVASFTGTPTTGMVPLTVQFTDTSTNAPTSWLWAFGDSATSTLQHPSHTYTASGTYTVSLKVTNAYGSNTLTRAGYITVSSAPVPPVASFTANLTAGTAPLTVQFTDLSTNTPTSWLWTFGDGGTSRATNPRHTYTAGGTYTVSLTVTNADGSDTETRTEYITVSAAPVTPAPPTPRSPALPYSEQRGETMSFLLMCFGALPFVGVFCVVVFLVMNGAQRGSGGI